MTDVLTSAPGEGERRCGCGALVSEHGLFARCPPPEPVPTQPIRIGPPHYDFTKRMREMGYTDEEIADGKAGAEEPPPPVDEAARARAAVADAYAEVGLLSVIQEPVPGRKTDVLVRHVLAHARAEVDRATAALREELDAARIAMNTAMREYRAGQERIATLERRLAERARQSSENHDTIERLEREKAALEERLTFVSSEADARVAAREREVADLRARLQTAAEALAGKEQGGYLIVTDPDGPGPYADEIARSLTRKKP